MKASLLAPILVLSPGVEYISTKVHSTINFPMIETNTDISSELKLFCNELSVTVYTCFSHETFISTDDVSKENIERLNEES